MIALAAGVVLLLLQLQTMQERLDQRDQKIEEQKGLIERKETFGAAMQELMTTAERFEPVRIGGLVPQWQLEYLAQTAWRHRYDAAALDGYTQEAGALTEDLASRLAEAESEASANATGSAYESALDALGGGFVTTVIDDADALCGSDVYGCVLSADPQVVHVDSSDISLPYMTDRLKTGIAYHEFAHVLQLTNPEPTETALAAFDGDHETMADCFSLTYLDGWTLDNRVWVDAYQYWDITLGYGLVCDEGQRQVVRDWYEQLGDDIAPVSQ